MNCIPDIAVCSGRHGISRDETCEPVDFCLYVIDSEVIAKMKGQTTLYTRKKGLENALKEAKVKKW